MPIRTAAAFFSLAAAAAVPAQQTLHLIPMPRQITAKGVLPLPNGVAILCPGCDVDDNFAATDLRDTLVARVIAVGSGGTLRVTLQRIGNRPGNIANDGTLTDAARAEGYTISSNGDAVTLTGSTAAGVFYAAQTLKQLIETSPNGTALIHPADVHQ